MWAGLYALNAPLLFLPHIVGWVQNIFKTMSRDNLAENSMFIALKERFHQRLGCEDPLFVKTQEIAEKVGISIEGVYFDDKAPHFSNMSVASNRQFQTYLFFRGNPLAAPEGSMHLEATLGHEFAHVKRCSSAFCEAAQSGILYAGASLFMILVGAVSIVEGLKKQSVSNIAIGLNMIAMSAIPGGLALVMACLSQAYKRNDEFLTDIHGAELTERPMEAIKNLAYLENTPRDPSRPRKIIEHLYNKIFGYSHPEIPERIACLKAVFNLDKSFAGEGLASKPSFKQSGDNLQIPAI